MIGLPLPAFVAHGDGAMVLGRTAAATTLQAAAECGRVENGSGPADIAIARMAPCHGGSFGSCPEPVESGDTSARAS
jgi:hypothetical protein